MSAPTWSAVEDGDLLDLIANTEAALPEPQRQWQHFVATLRKVAGSTGQIDQNVARPLLAGEIPPRRLSAFWRRAALEGLIRRDGWNESNHVESRNTGRPQKTYRWLGTQTSGHTSPAAGETPEAAARKGSQPAVSGTHLGT